MHVWVYKREWLIASDIVLQYTVWRQQIHQWFPSINIAGIDTHGPLFIRPKSHKRNVSFSYMQLACLYYPGKSSHFVKAKRYLERNNAASIPTVGRESEVVACVGSYERSYQYFLTLTILVLVFTPYEVGRLPYQLNCCKRWDRKTTRMIKQEWLGCVVSVRKHACVVVWPGTVPHIHDPGVLKLNLRFTLWVIMVNANDVNFFMRTETLSVWYVAERNPILFLLALNTGIHRRSITSTSTESHESLPHTCNCRLQPQLQC